MPKTKKIKPKFVVTKGGVDCGFATPIEVGLGYQLASGFRFESKLIGRRGILVKRPDKPTIFGGEKSAWIYAKIAGRVGDALRGTMVDEMPKLQPVVEVGEFAVRQLSL